MGAEMKRAGQGVDVPASGAIWPAVLVTPEDVQLLETRRFRIEEIYRCFGVPQACLGRN